MKNIIAAITLLVLTVLSVNAQTNTNTLPTPKLSLEDTNKDKGMPMELQLGGSGVTNPKNGSTDFGLNASLSVQPLSVPIWFGISQELSWSPSLEGATDLDSTYSFPILKGLLDDRLYCNVGWSVGATYDRSNLGWRTGPEWSLEWYTKGNAFVIGGVNYDLLTKQNGNSNWVLAKENALRYFFGVGIAF